MAAGRGQFTRSFMEGLARKAVQSAPGRQQRGPDGGKPGPGGTLWGPGEGQTGGERRKKRRSKAAPSSASGNSDSCQDPRTEVTFKKADFTKMKTSPSKENFLERLPSEILVNILSYLDASSLSCISQVSERLRQLANDNVLWHEVHMSQFGRRRWKPKSPAADAALKVDPVEDRSPGHWKRMYFRTMAEQEMSTLRRQMRDVSPLTGLPKQTAWVLRNVSWELTVCDRSGKEITMKQNRAHFFESSVIVRWSGGSFPKYRHISNIRLYGVRTEARNSPEAGRPGWRSLMLKLDVKTRRARFIGKDRSVQMRHLQPGFIVGTWRSKDRVAFVMVSLHYYKLVEKSLLGSPVCPYSEPVDNSDPDFGLHGYALNFVLHNTDIEIMSEHFCQLSCCAVQIQHGLVELSVVSRSRLSQHRALSGNIRMPWKCDMLEGSVENCCILTLTLLDKFQKPFWCVSSPVRIKMAKEGPSSDYSGEHFLMDFQNPEGRVTMTLVWLKEQKQFFLVSLTVYVNKRFSTAY